MKEPKQTNFQSKRNLVIFKLINLNSVANDFKNINTSKVISKIMKLENKKKYLTFGIYDKFSVDSLNIDQISHLPKCVSKKDLILSPIYKSIYKSNKYLPHHPYLSWKYFEKVNNQ